MKKTDWRPYVLFVCCLAFCCLLLSGAQRLIGAETAPMPNRPAVRAAALCAAPAASAQETSRQPGRTASPGEHAAQPRAASCGKEAVHPHAGSDANGNILAGARSYLHAVYQAFPLGDGFA